MRNLTDKQQLFLDVLFNEAKGDPSVAVKLAGYSKSVKTSSVTASLVNEINDLTRQFIAQSSTKAVYTMYNILETSDFLGARERIAAAKDILDRSGHTKVDKLEVKTSEPLFILPSKKDEDV